MPGSSSACAPRPARGWHDQRPMSVSALRGATTVEENDREAILEATREMLDELLRLAEVIDEAA